MQSVELRAHLHQELGTCSLSQGHTPELPLEPATHTLAEGGQADSAWPARLAPSTKACSGLPAGSSLRCPGLICAVL